MNILLSSNSMGHYVLSVASKRIAEKRRKDGSRTDLYIQVDFDFPRLASTLGWNGKIGRETCRHQRTDGTVDCPDCGVKASAFIEASQAWLDKHDGRSFRNKGLEYFDE